MTIVSPIVTSHWKNLSSWRIFDDIFVAMVVILFICNLYATTSDNLSTLLLVITPKIFGQQGEFAVSLTGLPKVFQS